jgi:hypothetical protein
MRRLWQMKTDPLRQAQSACPRCGSWSSAERCPQCGAHRNSAQPRADDREGGLAGRIDALKAALFTDTAGHA